MSNHAFLNARETKKFALFFMPPQFYGVYFNHQYIVKKRLYLYKKYPNIIKKNIFQPPFTSHRGSRTAPSVAMSRCREETRGLLPFLRAWHGEPPALCSSAMEMAPVFCSVRSSCCFCWKMVGKSPRLGD